MIWSILVTTIGLLFVLEGILPFLSPQIWRAIMQQMFIQSDRMLRMIGLSSMLLGVLCVCIAHDFL